MSTNKKALEPKDKGNNYVKQKKYAEAVKEYSEAIKLDGNDETFYSNRALAYQSLKKFKESEADARKCIALKPQWVKGYYRCAVALMDQERFQEAIGVLKQGLGAVHETKPAELDKAKDDLKKKLAEAEKEAAMRPPTVDDNGNPLTPAGAQKYLGNRFYKDGKLPEAIACYTKALDLAKNDEERGTLYLNRALCSAQLYHHDEVVTDATAALQINPNNAKALIRRALALEALEKYKQALEDMRKALSLEPGASVASQAIGRLTKAVNSQF